MNDRRLAEQVRIVGSGLLGASIGLGLRAHGVDVIVEDASPSARNLAIAYGAGRAPASDDAPGLIVVAVPPDVTADVVAAELQRFPDALV
ncbi:MAG: NAD(P)-binding domain-containing protein, partial [Pseudolysinimonas sp.]